VERRAVLLSAGESVLEGLERAGFDVPSGCRAGTCTKCMLQCEGQAPPNSQRGLRSTLVSEGFFLSCQARPLEDLTVRAAHGPEPIAAEVQGIDEVAEGVRRIFLTSTQAFEYKPGQYLDLLHPDGTARSYSIASLPATGAYELHIRKVPAGHVSGWVHQLEVGSAVQIRGPFGQCFHVTDDPKQKLVLIGAGTGLAPLMGIARDALDQGHQGPIDLVHGGLQPDRLYLRDELTQMAALWPQLRVHHCVLKDATKNEHEGSLDEVAIRLAGPLSKARAFLCGDMAIVSTLQRSLFMAGMASKEIFADPFAPAAAVKL
jgi:CDP-4-dehydro-6-deoxyglucose reductase